MSTFLITAINAATVMQALQKQLLASTDLLAMDGRITRGEEVNVNPDKAPWVGIYPLGEDYPVRTLGMGNGFRKQVMSIAVVVQNVSRTSGKDCQNVLEQFKQAVISCILSDTTIGGTMGAVDDFSVSYASPVKQGESNHFQSAVIKFTAENLVGVSSGG